MKYVVEEADRVMMRGCYVQLSHDQSWGEGEIPKMITFNHNVAIFLHKFVRPNIFDLMFFDQIFSDPKFISSITLDPGLVRNLTMV